MKRFRPVSVPLLAALIASGSLIAAPLAAQAGTNTYGQCVTRWNSPDTPATACVYLDVNSSNTTFVYQMRIYTRPPGGYTWSGLIEAWVQPPGKDFQSFLVVHKKVVTDLALNIIYFWSLNQSYPDESQACAEFITDSSIYYPPMPQGPICEYVT